ncbi:TVP38/TMEM64 family protein [Jannaschia sp. M317]|uniref:TVP38/TMEM64 family protein n=1 Tax=Jannaschia sp. M317 TaxID=2867011 RepID=UPI0021A57F28|nr:VTT domain-containing protein [Jannaschia sp. M317]UWQ17132.1 VTT domain-containing protein [Jannaschia sp. M317]
MNPRARIPWQIWIWPALLVVLAVVAWLLPWRDWVPLLRAWVESHERTGWLVFILVYVVVVMLPLPAAAMSVVGGLAFGWWGFPLSIAGSILGAIPPYLIGRHWLREPILRRIGSPRVLAADRVIARNAVIFVALLRLTPVLPFTVQNWLLGLTAVRFWPYIWATLAGLAPGTLAMVWIGEMGGLASAEVEDATLWLVGGGLAAFCVMVLWIGRLATRELRRAGFDEG